MSAGTSYLPYRAPTSLGEGSMLAAAHQNGHSDYMPYRIRDDPDTPPAPQPRPEYDREQEAVYSEPPTANGQAFMQLSPRSIPIQQTAPSPEQCKLNVAKEHLDLGSQHLKAVLGEGTSGLWAESKLEETKRGGGRTAQRQAALNFARTSPSEHMQLALDNFKSAEALVAAPIEGPLEVKEEGASIRCAVFTGMVHIYKNAQKQRVALQYAHKALKLQNKMDLKKDKAETQLNIAALLSSIGKHQQALRAAEDALDTVLLMEDASFHSHTVELASGSAPLPTAEMRDRIYHPLLQVLCFLNIGTELEHLGVLEGCLEAFRTAFFLAYMYLAPDHPMAQRAARDHSEVQRKVQHKADRESRVESIAKAESRITTLDFSHSKSPLPGRRATPELSGQQAAGRRTKKGATTAKAVRARAAAAAVRPNSSLGFSLHSPPPPRPQSSLY